MNDAASSIQEGLPPISPTVSAPPRTERSLRLWPGAAIVAIQWAAITGIGMLFPATPIQFMAMFMGPMIGAFVFLAWWLFFSRVSWMDRLLLPVACALF